MFISAIVFNGLRIHPISSSGGFKDVLELTHSGGNDVQFDFLIFLPLFFISTNSQIIIRSLLIELFTEGDLQVIHPSYVLHKPPTTELEFMSIHHLPKIMDFFRDIPPIPSQAFALK